MNSLLPHDETAERNLIGLALAWPGAILGRYRAEITREHFTAPERADIHDAIMSLADESDAHPDYFPVQTLLRQRGKDGAAAELLLCSSDLPPGFFGKLLSRIEGLAKARSLWHAAVEVQRSVESLTVADDPDTLVADATDRLERLASSRSGDSWKSLKSLWFEQIDRLEAAMNGDSPQAGGAERMPFGIGPLDSIVEGGERGRLLVIGAQTHVGKTALARAFACEMGMSHKVGWFGMESSCEEEGLNTLSYVSRIRQGSLRRGMLLAGEHGDLHRGMKRQPDVHIDDTPGLTMAEIASRARTLKQRSGLDVLIVDYVQLMGQAHSSRGATREQMISEDARRLKVLAGTLGVLVIALAQVNDEIDVTEGPGLQHFRESKAISKHADFVLTMSAPDGIESEGGDEPVARDLWIRKWRGKGARSIPVRLLLHGPTQRFSENEDTYHPPEPKHEARRTRRTP